VADRFAEFEELLQIGGAERLRAGLDEREPSG
jgi:hypothetical protein